MKRVKLVLASIVLAVLSRGAFAAVTNTWVGANTADGAADRTSLSDGANWSLGHVPKSGEVALMMMVNKNVNNTLDLGASDAAFAPSALVMEGGKRAYGSTIDVRAFANGDLLGKGTRTIPALPPEVAAALPDPNDVVVPPEGH